MPQLTQLASVYVALKWGSYQAALLPTRNIMLTGGLTKVSQAHSLGKV